MHMCVRARVFLYLRVREHVRVQPHVVRVEMGDWEEVAYVRVAVHAHAHTHTHTCACASIVARVEM